MMKTKIKENAATSQNKFRLSKWSIALIFIVIIGAVLRFWNFPHGYTFDPDATRDAIIAYEGARTWYFPLTGAFSSTGPYTFGPWYYVSLIVAAFIVPNPYTPWILMGLASLITIIVMYDIGRMVQSKGLGLLLAVMTALAPSEIMVGMTLSNISPVAVFAALSLWASIRILHAQHTKIYWYMCLGIFLGLAISAHYQSVGLLLMPVIVWFVSGEKRYKAVLLFLLGLGLTFIPFLIFNITNNWHTLRGMSEMYTSRDRIYVPNSWTLYLFQFWPSLLTYIFGTPWILSTIMLFSLPMLLGIQVMRKMVPRTVIVPAIVLLANFISLRYYWGERFWPYHYFLEPLILFLVGYSVYKLLSIKRYGLICFLLAVLPIIGSMAVYDINRQSTLAQDPDRTSEEVDAILQKFPNQRFALYKCMEDRSPKAETIAYLLRFEKIPTDGKVQRIGIQSGGCKHPNGNENYAPIKGTPVVDFSAVSDSALKSASWIEISTETSYKKSARWYK